MNHRVDWVRRETDTPPVLAYRDCASDGPDTVLLLHSLATDGSTWSPVAADMHRSGLRVVAGRSWPRPVGADRSRRHQPVADDLVRVLDAAQVERATAVGVSMGGIEAIALAAARPDRIDRVVVADSFAWLDPSIARGRIDQEHKAAAGGSMAEVAEAYVRATFDEPASAKARLVARLVAAMSADDYLAAVESCFTADVSRLLGDVAAPVLVLRGEDDAKTPPPLSEAIAAGIPTSTFRVLPGAGHLSHLDRPRRVRRGRPRLPARYAPLTNSARSTHKEKAHDQAFFDRRYRRGDGRACDGGRVAAAWFRRHRL